MRYLVINKKHIAIVGNSNKSRYPVIYSDFTPIKRKLSSREAARQYKQSLKNPQNWAIVDQGTSEVVR